MALILYYEGGNKREEADAKTVLDILCEVYPMYPWAVYMRGGGFFIRHLDFPTNWGMFVRFSDVAHDAAKLKREIIMQAGEWLERANLRRGLANGDEIGRVEGVPEEWQPRIAPIDRPIVIAEPELRDTPRPQVIKEMGHG